MLDRQMFSGIEPGTCLAVCLPLHSSPLTSKVLVSYVKIIFSVTGGLRDRDHAAAACSVFDLG